MQTVLDALYNAQFGTQRCDDDNAVLFPNLTSKGAIEWHKPASYALLTQCTQNTIARANKLRSNKKDFTLYTTHSNKVKPRFNTSPSRCPSLHLLCPPSCLLTCHCQGGYCCGIMLSQHEFA